MSKHFNVEVETLKTGPFQNSAYFEAFFIEIDTFELLSNEDHEY